jgi:uncharacterized membrane protein YfcA
LIGLGGAEFRLPVLVGPLGYSARRAMPLNLAISLVTLTVALMVRSRTLPVNQLILMIPVMLSVIASAMLAAYYGAGWTGRISNDVLKRIILVLLLAIGAALILEGLLPSETGGFIPDQVGWHILSGVIFGVAIGLFSSVLGVAGGELIIPTLVYAFGVNIKVAGTASLLISLPTVLVGMVRYARLGGYSEKSDLYENVAPMGVGSVIGAIVGGLLLGLVPARFLKVFLGLILCYSAWRIFE